MLSSTEKIKKFISLEIERGYDNRSVVGGMEKFLPIWRREAPTEGVSEEIIEKVSKFLSEYSDFDKERREQSIRNLLNDLGSPELFDRYKQRYSRAETTNRQNHYSGGENRSKEESSAPDYPEGSKYDHESSNSLRSESSVKPERKPVRIHENHNEASTIDSPVKIIPGIGPQNAKALARQGVYTIRDLLYYFPRRYDDYSKFKTINKLLPGEKVTIVCVVYSVENVVRGRYQITEAVVGDGTGMIRVSWFNQPWLIHQIQPGSSYVFSGKIDVFLGRPVMNGPEFEPTEQENLNTNRIVPVYPVNSNLKQNYLRRMIFNTVRHWANLIPEFLPETVSESADLMPLSKAIEEIHFPDSAELLEAARRRLAFDELFLVQLDVLRHKRNRTSATANRYRISDERMDCWIKSLPYELTAAQRRVLNEIRGDIDSGKPMNRLIQGDVGSGKTIVACLAALIISDAGGQSVLMAPTGILAEQHFRSFRDIIEKIRENSGDLNIDPNRIALLTGSTPESEKKEIYEKSASGEIAIVIGTHALLEDPVQFKNLDFIVVDEQHRFGVEQRATLRSKGRNPHLAVMTATPIPRSLALTVYGDLDLSVIDEMPQGRLPVKTFVVNPLGRERVYRHVIKEVKNGHQAFIIYPLVESGDDEHKEGKSAVEASEFLDKEVFPEQRVALLHGRMKGEEKDAILEAFKNKEYDILVSTSVIEVGVDIPNATTIVIEGANRFGLAQLHQFRGRVGRGNEQSYCFLIAENDDAIENERLLAMTQTNDGFKLAELDLNQRGPGDFLGSRQSGFMDFKLASFTDLKLIESARNEALKVFEADPELSSEENKLLKEQLEKLNTIHIGELS
ncbi:MAG TPA: ATP-dependent DNA helicase RecG [Flexilinea sp.]|nr:ATP-dependent DNA helicase RecG [Flexilinea sp.]